MGSAKESDGQWQFYKLKENKLIKQRNDQAVNFGECINMYFKKLIHTIQSQEKKCLGQDLRAMGESVGKGTRYHDVIV